QNRLRDEYISSIIATELKLNGIPNEKYINGVKEKCLIYSVINSSLHCNHMIKDYDKFIEVSGRMGNLKNNRINLENNDKKLDKNFFIGILKSVKEDTIPKYEKDLSIKQLKERELEVKYWTIVYEKEKEVIEEKKCLGLLEKNKENDRKNAEKFAGKEKYMPKNLYVMESVIRGVLVKEFCKYEEKSNAKIYTEKVEKPEMDKRTEKKEIKKGIIKIGKHEEKELNYHYNENNKIIGGDYQSKIWGIDLFEKL
ncbi:MAG: hypothetical protein ACRC6K_00640, partial [Fusobacteriaceae bacterium]